MIILGIDPGTTSVGYAVLEPEPGSIKLLKAGLLAIKSKTVTLRLQEVYGGLNDLINLWRPEILAMEKLFFAKNRKTALAVAESRGVILLTTTLAKLKVCEYTPLEVKKNITGDGRADKNQVEKMVRYTLKETKNLKLRDDVFDAIAVALTCYFKERQKLN